MCVNSDLKYCKKIIDFYKITDDELISCISQVFHYFMWTTSLFKRDLLFCSTYMPFVIRNVSQLTT